MLTHLPQKRDFKLLVDTFLVKFKGSYRIDNTHAEDMVITFVRDAGVVFVSALYNLNLDAPSTGPGSVVLNDAFTVLGLNVSTIAGGHGGTSAIEDFEGILGE